MNLSLSEEQLLIKASAEKFFTEKLSFEQRQKLLNDDQNIKTTLLNVSKDLGWLALPFKNKYGGLDGSTTDVMILNEVFGSALSIDPYIFLLLMPGKAIELFCDNNFKSDFLKKIIDGNLRASFCFAEPLNRFNYYAIDTKATKKGKNFLVNGKKNLVIGGNLCSHFIIPAKDEEGNVLLFLIEKNTKNLFLKNYKTISDYHAVDIELDNIELQGSTLISTVPIGEYKKKIDFLIDYINMCICSDALGVIEKMYELTLTYVKTREQFGKKIGAFQVIQHKLVDMYIKKEEMRALNYMGQISLDNDHDDLRRKNVSLNKIFLASHGKTISQDCIQLHGGMGVANEMQIGHYFKRLTFFCTLLGNLDFYLNRYANNNIE